MIDAKLQGLGMEKVWIRCDYAAYISQLAYPLSTGREDVDCRLSAIDAYDCIQKYIRRIIHLALTLALALGLGLGIGLGLARYLSLSLFPPSLSLFPFFPFLPISVFKERH